MTTLSAVRTGVELHPDLARVVARLFIPGEEMYVAHYRAREIVERVMVIDESEVETLVQRVRSTFEGRHSDYEKILLSHATVVAAHLPDATELSAARTLLLGASFTSEYALEAAALCNPSTVLHPDQTNLQPGQARLVLSVRGIGEGHVSSIEFCSAVIGPGTRWSFEPRTTTATAGRISAPRWQRAHLEAVLSDLDEPDELSFAVVRALPDRFDMADFERTVAQINPDLVSRSTASSSLHAVREVIASAYVVEFDEDSPLAERVLLPWASEESHGMEDARFTRFEAPDGSVEYRATYTAYDGQRIAPRLIISPDLCRFDVHRLAGPAARNKGMALFPRLVGGRHLALCRSDGESTSLASSPDGFVWTAEQVIHAPTHSWETAQVGNCGPPLETERGWLVLTHGVGAMRTYAIGAMLLDLHDPRIVRGHLARPLVEPAPEEQNGYVPNVVYSCGGIIHDGVVWLPYGIGDSRIGVASVNLDELLDAMVPDSG